MNKSKIQWTDYTWAPVTGCSKISAGCRNCYAEAYHQRFMGGDFSVKLHPDRLQAPLQKLKGFFDKHWRRPRVFVCPMADLFHDRVPEEFIEQVWWTMALSPHIDFVVLTKRPARMQEVLSSEFFREAATALSDEGHHAQYPLPNVWIGVTAESQQEADRRIPILLQTPAAIRWVSIEPMLGPIELNDYIKFYVHGSEFLKIDWVVAGGESGPSARSMETEWVRSVLYDCMAWEVPFFFKQWGPQKGEMSLDGDLPLLDGQVYNQFPKSRGI